MIPFGKTLRKNDESESVQIVTKPRHKVKAKQRKV